MNVNSTPLVTNGNIRLKATRYGLMLYNMHDRYIGRSLDEYGEFSYGESHLFERIIRPGMIAVDVGANIGVHTLTLSRLVGPVGHVIAVEPQRALFQMLCANLALNELSNVRALQVGAGRQNGRAFLPKIDYGRPENFAGISLATQAEGEAVQVISIDSLALPACHFVKIDVEGMELEAIDGGASTIAKNRPIMFVENDRLKKSHSLIERIMSLRYVLYWHRAPLFNPSNHFGNKKNLFGRILSTNMLCVPQERKLVVRGLKEIATPDERP
jgi:FkbM family methyltransferase